MIVPKQVVELISGVEPLSEVITALTVEWSPDPAPLTVAMSDAGHAFAVAAPDLSERDAATVLARLESMLCDGTDDIKDAAATGFLEAMVSVLDEAPESKWILRFLGTKSNEYLVEWAAFCGADVP